MSEFIWQSSDGDADNPVSWGIGLDTNDPTGLHAKTTATDPTVDLSVDTVDLSTVSVGDTLKLVGRTDGKNSGEFFEITAIEDAGAGTLEVSPTPSVTDIAGTIIWFIYGALPGANAATDDIKFPANSIVGLTKGLDQSGQGKFTSIKVHPSFGGEFASLNNPFIASATEVLYEGTKGFHYKDGGSATDLLTINARSSVLCTLQGEDAAEITNVRVAAGNVTALALETSRLFVSEVGGIPTLVHWDISCSFALPTLYMNRGRMFSDKSITNIRLSGGILQTNSMSPDGAFAVCRMSGGHYIQNAVDTSMTVYVLGGFLDFWQDERAKTISTLRVWPGAKVSLPDWVMVTAGGHIYEELITGS